MRGTGMHGGVEKGRLKSLEKNRAIINTTQKRCLFFITGLIIHSWRLGFKKTKQRLKSKSKVYSRLGSKWK